MVLSEIYLMFDQSSTNSRASAYDLLLKFFDESSMTLMATGAKRLSVNLAMLTTYLCGRFQAYGP